VALPQKLRGILCNIVYDWIATETIFAIKPAMKVSCFLGTGWGTGHILKKRFVHIAYDSLSYCIIRLGNFKIF
jgi:hypothetical protein